MPNNQSLLELDFGIGHYNGAMDIAISVDDLCVIRYTNINDTAIRFSHSINWPCTVTISVSGKNAGHDTQVDEQGKITADKYVQLQALRVDHVEPGIEYMKSIALETDNQTINCLYWGFNGQVTLNFDCDDSFLWHLSQRVQQNQGYVITQTKI